MRPLRALAALLFAAVTLTGCIKIDMNITISKDADTVTGSMIFALEKAALTAGGLTPDKTFGELSGDTTDLPEGSRTEVYDDGKFYGQRIIFENVPFADFNKSNQKNGNAPKLVHEDGKYIFTMKADATTARLTEAVSKLAIFDMKFAVTFPGKVIETDSLAKIDGQTVSWSLKMNQSYDLRAVSGEAASVPWLLISVGGGLLCLLLVAGAAVFAIRMTRKPDMPGTPVTSGTL